MDDIWCMVHDVWRMVRMMYGVWCMLYGVWRTVVAAHGFSARNREAPPLRAATGEYGVEVAEMGVLHERHVDVLRQKGGGAAAPRSRRPKLRGSASGQDARAPTTGIKASQTAQHVLPQLHRDGRPGPPIRGEIHPMVECVITRYQQFTVTRRPSRLINTRSWSVLHRRQYAL